MPHVLGKVDLKCGCTIKYTFFKNRVPQEASDQHVQRPGRLMKRYCQPHTSYFFNVELRIHTIMYSVYTVYLKW